MSTWLISLVALSAALALVALGGGLYEYLVVDPAWTRKPDIARNA